MNELEARQRHNKDEQLRFIRDAAEDGLIVMFYVSTLDGSPCVSPDGHAWGMYAAAAREVVINPLKDSVLLPGLDRYIPLGYVYALTAAVTEAAPADAKRRLVVLDNPAQQSAAADMANNPIMRQVAKVPLDAPKYQLHPNHDPDQLAHRRRSALRLVKGGKS